MIIISIFTVQNIDFISISSLFLVIIKLDNMSKPSKKQKVDTEPASFAVPYECDKYVTTIDDLRKTLDKYGVAIIPNVLTVEECASMTDGIWTFFEHITQKWITPINRSDQSTWSQFYKLKPEHSMLIHYWHVGHAQVSWDIRQKEKIINIFAKLWNVSNEELLVSFDGLSFNIPPEITKTGWNDGSTWYHTDQSYLRNDFECVQSWITSEDVNEGDATLAIMEGSHKFHETFAKKFNVDDDVDDWYLLEPEEEDFYVKKGCSYVKIKCPKGSIVFWDSRTIHCGTEALKTRKQANFRSIIYLCYLPRAWTNYDALVDKRIAFTGMYTTSHWATKALCFTSTDGNTKITKPKKPVLTDLGEKLAGF